MTSAKESGIVPLKMNSGWYKLSTDILKPLMDERSRTLDLIREKNFDVKTAKSMMRTVKKIYKMELNQLNQDVLITWQKEFMPC